MFDRNLEYCKGAKCRASGLRAGEGWEHQAETKGQGLAAGMEANSQGSVQMRSRRKRETAALRWTQARLLRSLKYEIGDPRPGKKKAAIKEGIQIKKLSFPRKTSAPERRPEQIPRLSRLTRREAITRRWTDQDVESIEWASNACLASPSSGPEGAFRESLSSSLKHGTCLAGWEK